LEDLLDDRQAQLEAVQLSQQICHTVPLEAPLESLVYGWHGISLNRLVAYSVQHVIEVLKHLCGIFRNFVYAIKSLVCMNGVWGLQGNAGLFESEGEEGDGLGDAVDLEALTGYFAADCIEDQ
jgi:hypothetical protein